MNNYEPGVSGIIFSGLLKVPESKPPIKYITNVRILPILTKAYSRNDKIIVQGILAICLEYMPERSKLKKNLFFKLPFGHFLKYFGKGSKSCLTLKVVKEHQECLLAGRRKIKIYVSIQITRKDYLS